MGVLSGLAQNIFSTAANNSAFNAAMSGRIYFEEAKTTTGSLQTAFPFAVFHFITHMPDYTFTNELSNTTFQWSLFDNNSSASTMLTNIGKLHDAFDAAVLSVSGWTFVRIDREMHELIAPDDNGIRMSVTGYRAIFQKN